MAQRRLRTLLAALQRLRRYPCLHPAGALAPAREATASGYRIIYDVEPDTGDNDTAGDVVVLRIFPPGQDRTALDVR